MTDEEAKRILDPVTSVEELAKIEYYNGFSKTSTIEIVNEACIIACGWYDKLFSKEK